MKSAGTEKPGKEGKAKEFSLVFYPGCTSETSRPMVLVVWGVSRPGKGGEIPLSRIDSR